MAVKPRLPRRLRPLAMTRVQARGVVTREAGNVLINPEKNFVALCATSKRRCLPSRHSLASSLYIGSLNEMRIRRGGACFGRFTLCHFERSEKPYPNHEDFSVAGSLPKAMNVAPFPLSPRRGPHEESRAFSRLVAGERQLPAG